MIALALDRAHATADAMRTEIEYARMEERPSPEGLSSVLLQLSHHLSALDCATMWAADAWSAYLPWRKARPRGSWDAGMPTTRKARLLVVSQSVRDAQACVDAMRLPPARKRVIDLSFQTVHAIVAHASDLLRASGE